MLIAIIILVALGILVVFSWQIPEPGKMRQAHTGIPLPTAATTDIPQTVRDDALSTAKTIHRRNRRKQLGMASDMLATYRALREIDVLILFNSGGYGWSALDKASGYATIVDAIEDELHTRGCRVAIFSYQRAYPSLRGYISEILNAGAKSIAKPTELVARLRFLWRHLPQLKVLMAAESNGTVMSNQVMRLSPEEGRLFSIEFGPPFWYGNFISERVLNMRSNGTVPDAFSYGHWSRAFKANFEALRGKNSDAPGNVLLYVGAPGHDYNWHDYPVIRENVLAFLKKHFGCS
jgi:hypothetical protein